MEFVLKAASVLLTAEEARLLYDLAVGKYANLDPKIATIRSENPWLYELGKALP